MANDLRNIVYCDEHWKELIDALTARNLQAHMSHTKEEFAQRLMMGDIDVTFEASTMITTTALNLLGSLALTEANNCPVCALHAITHQVADFMAQKYCRSH